MVSAPASHEILGFKITPMTIARILQLIDDNGVNRTTCIIGSQNLHGIYKYFTDEAFPELHEHAYVRIDGMPLIWLARLHGLKVRREHRAALIDCFPELLSLAARKGWRIFYLGGRPDVLHNGRQKLHAAYPGLQFEGHHGFFASSGAENQAVIDQINAYQPHVLMVGMGMGRQERWILDNRQSLRTNCIWTCGALLEYFAGTVATSPRWLGQIGLEWVYRFGTNPRRFAWRYLVEPWLVIGLIVSHRLRRSHLLKS
jgi:N-acetylglucosaminyldiphosphoundecaprenol N-acetyl-beta-D-mannosaminyltransferase